MPAIQVWMTEDDIEVLKFLKEFHEKQIDMMFEGKAYRVGTGRRVHRPKINYTYVVRAAIHDKWKQIKSQEEEREKHARVVDYQPGFKMKKTMARKRRNDDM